MIGSARVRNVNPNSIREPSSILLPQLPTHLGISLEAFEYQSEQCLSAFPSVAVNRTAIIKEARYSLLESLYDAATADTIHLLAMPSSALL